MSAREYLWIIKESALGTPMTTPTAGTDSIYIRLVDGNAFGMVADPVIEQIMYGGGVATPADAISDHYGCTGQLKTKLYPSQAALLLAWAITPVNTAQTAPWTTTEPPGDLASCSVYHAVRNQDGTYRRKRFAGCKVSSWGVEVSRGGTTATLTLGLVAAQELGNAMEATSDPTSTEFPAPAESAYPTAPYTFKATSGLLSVGGNVRTMYESLSLSGTNALDGRWFESSHLQVIEFCGRSTTLNAALMLKATPDDRASFEALTTQAVTVGFAGPTGQTLTVAYNGQNTLTAVPYDLPLNQVFMQPIALQNRWDPTANSGAGGDVAISFS